MFASGTVNGFLDESGRFPDSSATLSNLIQAILAELFSGSLAIVAAADNLAVAICLWPIAAGNLRTFRLASTDLSDCARTQIGDGLGRP